MDNNYISRVIDIGGLKLGGHHQVRIQSMCNTPTRSVNETLRQIKRLHKNGCELVRLSVGSRKEIQAIREIKNNLKSDGLNIPIIADVHNNPKIAIEVSEFVDKVRINPGNFTGNGTVATVYLRELVECCKNYDTAIRIGVNQGSLSSDILFRYGNTTNGMVQSVLSYLNQIKELNFEKIVLSLKSSDQWQMVKANIELVRELKRLGLNYPIHLGVTEAGLGKDAKLKSIIGIGSLLQKGIGDTIRVSLSGNPADELKTAKSLVDFFGKHKEKKQARRFNLFKNNILERKPIVISEARNPEDLECAEYTPDFIYLPEMPEKTDYPINKNFILSYEEWKKVKNKANFHPILTINDLYGNDDVLPEFSFLRIRPGEVNTTVKKIIYHRQDFILVLETNQYNFDQINTCLNLIHLANIENKVVLNYSSEITDKNEVMVEMGANIGSILSTGYGDGIWLSSKNSDVRELNYLAFDILQVSGRRNIRTSFVGCPTCGRTKFDLNDLYKEIKTRVGHIKGLKIAIMGCYINGPGEVGVSDYGLIGSGPEKVSLYKKYEVVKKNIDVNNATEDLIDLLKKDGVWSDN